jgi:membrane fusion protein, heavy metal efflux system
LDQLANSLADALQPWGNDEMLPRLPLIAPIAGRVIEVSAVEGEQVQGGQLMYRILDDDQVWLAARVGEFDAGRLSDSPSARVRLDDGSSRWLDLETEALVDMAGSIVDQDRAIVVRYAIENAQHRLRPGLSVTAFIETRRTMDAVTIPDDAVLLDAGRPVVFVHLSGETFEKRHVELGIRDGPQIEVRSGVDAGQRVVTQGGYAVKLAGQEPADIGHGHVH